VIQDQHRQIFEMNQTIDQKERLYSHIKEQVEELSRQLESLQQNMQAKDQESQDKITKLKNEVK
jgi:prefoldin subunit 5